MAIFPRGQGPSDPRRALIAQTNRYLALVAGKPRVTFVDLTSQWLQPDGTLSPEIMPGFVHPNDRGYQLWADALQAVLPK
jgi:beta-glucosidase